ncbi:SCO family protein [Neobacillus dielmonensis]|uniref:SCO family protein n=1 Tax=Neobacillus dielmonensis TaxID=1347369 RepID=UPI0005A95051|nr:SCO family protein [Neobacillus dielmonensis]
MKRIYIICSLAIFIGVTSGISFFLIRDANASIPGDAALIDQNGEKYTFGEDKTKLKLVEFVYTHCPDVCPMTTQKMVELKQDLEKNSVFGKNIEFITVTIDPYRDRPGELTEYMNGFKIENNGDWLFLTGENKNIETDQKTLRKITEPLQFQYKDPGNGQFIHTTFAYLVNEDNKFVTKFPMGKDFNKQEVYDKIMDQLQ